MAFDTTVLLQTLKKKKKYNREIRCKVNKFSVSAIHTHEKDVLSQAFENQAVAQSILCTGAICL